MSKNRKKDLRDLIIFGLIFITLMLMLPGFAFAQAAATAAVVAAPWYTTVNWTSIIVAFVGSGGIFIIIKWWFDYDLGKKDKKLEGTKEENTMESRYVEAAEKLRREYAAMVDELRVEVERLRDRIIVLEWCLKDNDIPLPRNSKQEEIIKEEKEGPLPN